MRISECLKPEVCIMDLKSVKKEDAIRELALTLVASGKVNNIEKFIDDILAREKLGSTGIGNRVGIPHSRTDAVEDFVIAFGRSSGGIDFQALDGEKVDFVFLMGANPQELNVYLRRLAELSKLLMENVFRRELGLAKTPQDVIDTIKKFEQGNV